MEVNTFRFPTTPFSPFSSFFFLFASGPSEPRPEESLGVVRIYMVPLLPLVPQYVSFSLCSPCLLHLHTFTDCFSSWPVEQKHAPSPEVENSTLIFKYQCSNVKMLLFQIKGFV